MKKHYPIIAKVCLLIFLTAGFVMPSITRAIDIDNWSWLGIFGIKNDIEEQTEQDLDSQPLIMLGAALLQINSPIGVKKPSVAPYCAYNPKMNYCLATVTAYSSTIDQTDSSPFTTANGETVRDGIVACNFLPFGTRVRFPDIYGDKIFSVEDRMAKKNNHKLDIWFPSRQDAKEFGVQRLKVEILN